MSNPVSELTMSEDDMDSDTNLQDALTEHAKLVQSYSNIPTAGLVQQESTNQKEEEQDEEDEDEDIVYDPDSTEPSMEPSRSLTYSNSVTQSVEVTPMSRDTTQKTHILDDTNNDEYVLKQQQQQQQQQAHNEKEDDLDLSNDDNEVHQFSDLELSGDDSDLPPHPDTITASSSAPTSAPTSAPAPASTVATVAAASTTVSTDAHPALVSAMSDSDFMDDVSSVPDTETEPEPVTAQQQQQQQQQQRSAVATTKPTAAPVPIVTTITNLPTHDVTTSTSTAGSATGSVPAPTLTVNSSASSTTTPTPRPTGDVAETRSALSRKSSASPPISARAASNEPVVTSSAQPTTADTVAAAAVVPTTTTTDSEPPPPRAAAVTVTRASSNVVPRPPSAATQRRSSQSSTGSTDTSSVPNTATTAASTAAATTAATTTTGQPTASSGSTTLAPTSYKSTPNPVRPRSSSQDSTGSVQKSALKSSSSMEIPSSARSGASSPSRSVTILSAPETFDESQRRHAPTSTATAATAATSAVQPRSAMSATSTTTPSASASVQAAPAQQPRATAGAGVGGQANDDEEYDEDDSEYYYTDEEYTDEEGEELPPDQAQPASKSGSGLPPRPSSATSATAKQQSTLLPTSSTGGNQSRPSTPSQQQQPKVQVQAATTPSQRQQLQPTTSTSAGSSSGTAQSKPQPLAVTRSFNQASRKPSTVSQQSRRDMWRLLRSKLKFTPYDFVRSLGAAPVGVCASWSTHRNLKGDYSYNSFLKPTLLPNGLGYNDLALDSATGRLKANATRAFRISCMECLDVPLAANGTRIYRRRVRFALYDKRNLLSNFCEISALQDPLKPHTWSFDSADSFNVAVCRTNSSDLDLCLYCELVALVEKDTGNRAANTSTANTKSNSNEEGVELSFGWCLLPLGRDLQAMEFRQHDMYLTGGTIAEPKNFDPVDVGGTGRFANLFRKRGAMLKVKLDRIGSIAAPHCTYLPESFLVPLRLLHPTSVYRMELAQQLMYTPNPTNVTNRESVVLRVFPFLIDDYLLSDIFARDWHTASQQWLRVQRNDFKFLLGELEYLCKRLYPLQHQRSHTAVAHHDLVSLDEFRTYLSQKSSVALSQPSNDTMYEPFTIAEVCFHPIRRMNM